MKPLTRGEKIAATGVVFAIIVGVLGLFFEFAFNPNLNFSTHTLSEFVIGELIVILVLGVWVILQTMFSLFETRPEPKSLDN
jgi:hypothetical protein